MDTTATIPIRATHTYVQTEGLTWDHGDLEVPPRYSQSDPTTNTCALTSRPASPANPHTIQVQSPPSYEELFPKTCLPISRKAFADCCIKSSDAAKMFATCCFESSNRVIITCTPSQEDCGEVLESPHTVGILSGIIGLVLCIENEAIAGAVFFGCCCLVESVGYCDRDSSLT